MSIDPSYPLTLLGNSVFSLASRFRLIPSSSGDVEIGAYTQVPGSARAEAERRRYVNEISEKMTLILNFNQGDGVEGSGPATCSFLVTFRFTVYKYCTITSSSATPVGSNGLH